MAYDDIKKLKGAISRLEDAISDAESNIETDPALSSAIEELENGYRYIENLCESGGELIDLVKKMADAERPEEEDEYAYTIKDIFNALFALSREGADLNADGVSFKQLAEKLRRVSV
jgi:uncharacterized coiled-coil DUF342 family protein